MAKNRTRKAVEAGTVMPIGSVASFHVFPFFCGLFSKLTVTASLIAFLISATTASGAPPSPQKHRVTANGCRFFQLDGKSWKPGAAENYPANESVIDVSPHPLGPGYFVFQNLGSTFLIEGKCLTPETPPPLSASTTPTQAPVATATPAATPVREKKSAQKHTELDETQWAALLSYWSFEDTQEIVSTAGARTKIRSKATVLGFGVGLEKKISAPWLFRGELGLLSGSVDSATENSTLFTAKGSSFLGLSFDPSLRYSLFDSPLSLGVGIPLFVQKIYFPTFTGYLIEAPLLRYGVFGELGWYIGHVDLGLKGGFIQIPKNTALVFQGGWRF